MSLAPGTRLGPYEIAAQIGAGGMGEVYRARDDRLRRDVAIKVLPQSFTANSEWRLRFEQEARAASALNHPNILAVFDLGEHDGAPFVVSELLDGQSLRARLADGPLPVRKATEYAIQIAHGLAAAHEKGIVHRDLKPENLYVTRDGRLKILDFGLAKLTQDGGTNASTLPAQTPQTQPGTLLGTVGYMAPEQVRGQPADHRSDIFSFGLVLYEMLAGKRAFGGTSGAEIMSAILRDDPPPLRDLPPGLEQIIQHCLEKNPAERFQSARDLAFHLQALSGQSSVEVRAPAVSAPPRRLFGAGLALFAMAAAAVAGFVAARRMTASSAAPPAARKASYHRLTFKRGFMTAARFAPDGQTVLHSASWDGAPVEVQSARTDSFDSRPFGEPGAALFAVSPAGEVALGLRGKLFWGGVHHATLARVPLGGGAPREMLEDVYAADFSDGGKELAVAHLFGGKCRVEWPIGKTVYETDEGWINFLRVSPRGDAVAFLEHPTRWDDQGMVAVVDRKGEHRVLAKGFVSAAGLAWSPSGDEVWFTASEHGETRAVQAVSLAGQRRELLQLPTNATLHDVARDGRMLLTHDDVHAQIRAIVAGEAHERELSWRDFSVANDLSADGKTVVLTEQGEGSSQNYAVFLRKIDGSPAIRLGDGTARALSPDGRWVAAYLFPDTHRWLLMPTGAGEGRPIAAGALEDFFVTGWFPDSQHLLVYAHEKGKAARGWSQSIADGKQQPITPEGVWPIAVTPDGKWIVGYSAGESALYPAAGGPPRKAAALGKTELPIRAIDDHTVFTALHDGDTAKIFRVDLVRGKRELVRTLAASDAAGVMGVGDIEISADGKTLVYGFLRFLSDLYVVEGLK